MKSVLTQRGLIQHVDVSTDVKDNNERVLSIKISSGVSCQQFNTFPPARKSLLICGNHIQQRPYFFFLAAVGKGADNQFIKHGQWRTDTF